MRFLLFDGIMQAFSTFKLQNNAFAAVRHRNKPDNKRLFSPVRPVNLLLSTANGTLNIIQRAGVFKCFTDLHTRQHTVVVFLSDSLINVGTSFLEK